MNKLLDFFSGVSFLLTCIVMRIKWLLRIKVEPSWNQLLTDGGFTSGSYSTIPSVPFSPRSLSDSSDSGPHVELSNNEMLCLGGMNLPSCGRITPTQRFNQTVECSSVPGSSVEDDFRTVHQCERYRVRFRHRGKDKVPTMLLPYTENLRKA